MNVGTLFTLMGGLALLLQGVKFIGEGLQRAADHWPRKLLTPLTRTRAQGLLTGTLLATVLQSSSATAIMVVGFVNAGLMTLAQATGVIMGANIGVTITAQLVAIPLQTLAPALLLVGVAMQFGFKHTRVPLGQFVTGLGMLYVGVHMMSSALLPLRGNAKFLGVIDNLGRGPLLALSVGAAVTALLRSATPAIALTQVLAGCGIIPLEMAVYLCLGSAVGACVTVLLVASAQGPLARRAALIHLLCNLVGAILLSALLRLLPMARWIAALSPGNALRQVANAYALLKLVELAILYPFASALVRASALLVRGKDPVDEEPKLIRLDDLMLAFPPLALAQALREVERMARLSIDNLDRSMRAFFARDMALAEEVVQSEAVIDCLNCELASFLVKLGQTVLPPDDVPLIASLYHVINDLERVGDHAMNMAEHAQSCKEDKLLFTKQGEEELRDMVADVLQLLELSLDLFKTRRRSGLQQAADLEERIDRKEKLYRQRHVARLIGGLCTPQSGLIFTDMLSNLERVADHATNIAFSIARNGARFAHG